MRQIWKALAVGTTALVLGGVSPAVRADDADDKHEEQIEARLQSAPDLKNNRIDVDVDDGIAVLEGKVDSQQEKKEAARLAHVEGVLGVNNRLQVRGASK